MSKQPTFLDACLTGRAFLDDVDDWVDVWHDAHGAPRGKRENLESFLGFNDLEYSLWAEKPSLLRIIVRARKDKKPVEDVQAAARTARVAARTVHDDEARQLLEWLRETGRLDDDDKHGELS